MSSIASNALLSSVSRLVCPASSVVSKSATSINVTRTSCPHLLRARPSQLPQSGDEDHHHHVASSSSSSSSVNAVRKNSPCTVKNFREIPSPRHLPLIGTTFDLMAAGGAPFLHTYCDHRHKSLGPIFREKIGNLDCVFVADAEMMKRIYSNEGQYPVHSVPEPWIIFNDMKGIQRGLFFMDGPEWSHRRKSLNRIFLKKDTISGYSDDFNNVITDLLSRWTLTSRSASSSSSPSSPSPSSSSPTSSSRPHHESSGHLSYSLVDGERERVTHALLPDLERELYNWSVESLGMMIFGKRLGCVTVDSDPPSDELKVDTIHEFVQCIQQLFVESAQMTMIPAKLAYHLNLPVWRRFVGAAERALSLARTYVEDNVQQMLVPSPSSSSHSLGQCPFQSVQSGDVLLPPPPHHHHHAHQKGVLQQLTVQEKIDKDELVNIITDLFLAAADTTSHATQWALYLLARSPDSQEKLFRETSQILGGDPEGEMKEHHLTSMPFVKGVIKESLRLYPVAPFLSRVLDKDITLSGYKVPAGKLIIMSLYTTGRDPEYFQDPDSFRPERWLRDSKTKQHEVQHPHAFLPFGVGVRSCIGRRVAEMQMQFLLARVVQKFRLRTDKEVGIKLRMITTPEEPIQLGLVPRN